VEYFYGVTAVDDSGNESSLSAIASATPQLVPAITIAGISYTQGTELAQLDVTTNTPLAMTFRHQIDGGSWLGSTTLSEAVSLHTHYVDTSDTTAFPSGSVVTIEASATGAVTVDDDVTVLRAETTPPTLAGTFVSATFDTTTASDVEIDLAIDGLELVQGRAQWKIGAISSWAPSVPSWAPGSKTADEFTISMATGVSTSVLDADTLYTRYALRDSLDNESAYTDAVKTVFVQEEEAGGSSGNINSWADLAAMADTLDGDYTLGADLDSNSTGYATYAADWAPIGDSTTPFVGTFDGQGYSISDLKITSGTDKYIGLFGVIDGATVENVGLINCTVDGGSNYCGTLSGRAQNSAEILNCYVTGSVTATTGYAGGLVYFLTASSVTNCYTDVDVSGGLYTGGFVARGYLSGTYTNCFSVGDVSDVPATYYGGFCGRDQGGTWTNCGWFRSATTAADQTMDTGDVLSYMIMVGASGDYTEGDISWFYNATSNVYDPGANDWDFTNIWQENASALPTLRLQ
jgi:hypothetical protein